MIKGSKNASETDDLLSQQQKAATVWHHCDHLFGNTTSTEYNEVLRPNPCSVKVYGKQLFITKGLVGLCLLVRLAGSRGIGDANNDVQMPTFSQLHANKSNVS